MRLSFSTHGWCDKEWDFLVESAAINGISGIEIASDQCDVYSQDGGPFHKYNITATIRDLREKGIAVAVLNSGCDMASAALSVKAEEEIISRIKLAQSLSVKYVILFGAKGGSVDISRNVISKVLPEARKRGITLLVKTSGMYSNTALLKELLDGFACDDLGASWNIYAPYREFNEDPQTTIQNLGAYVRHVHVCDSKESHGDLKHALVGEGDLPIPEMMTALASINYDGFMSLRWDPLWIL